MRPAYLISFLLPAALAQYDYGSGGSSTTTAAAPAAPSQSGVHDVQVGANSKLAYDPDTVMAAVGEKVRFWFNPLNHSVVQSSFDKPCVPSSATAIFSGFQPVSSGQGVRKKLFVSFDD
jgi:plastocyanin